MGGGIVPGSVILIGGEPGVGKSTLLFQIADKLSNAMQSSVMYVSGEESAQQLSIRAKRMNIPSTNSAQSPASDFYLLCETCFENIVAKINSVQSKIIIVDSIQTMLTIEIPSSAGSIVRKLFL